MPNKEIALYPRKAPRRSSRWKIRQTRQSHVARWSGSTATPFPGAPPRLPTVSCSRQPSTCRPARPFDCGSTFPPLESGPAGGRWSCTPITTGCWNLARSSSTPSSPADAPNSRFRTRERQTGSGPRVTSSIVKPPLKPFALTIFFPCYNEEANVERVTRAAVQAGRKLADDLEVIIVNDGSRDRTGEIADRLAAEIPEVRAVHNQPNRGYGGALQRGFREARKNWIFYTDGDGQFDFGEMAGVVPLLEQFDIASCYRIARADSLLRKLNAFAWTTLVNLLFRIRLRDIDCAFKFYPKTFIDAIQMHSTGALMDTEMLAKARNLGLGIGQVGVHHYPRTAGQQTGANLRVILRAFRELFKLRRQIRNEGRGR
ncbi:MAG: glycosyltransferase family 2 protein [Planctomycetes bacterium]|nr:glycosyltransferase family 2 protein [Planctomycetota bacterium]